MNSLEQGRPDVIICHCDSPARKYYTRYFINVFEQKVIRTFYRCLNCGSCTPKDYIPEMEDKIISIYDLIKQSRS